MGFPQKCRPVSRELKTPGIPQTRKDSQLSEPEAG
jgi:hypothetical protein